VRVVVSTDGRRVRRLRVTGPVDVRAGGPGWHLVALDLASAANALRAEPLASG
jgi:hypothetical protein